MKRTKPLQRKTPLKRNTPLPRRKSPLPRIGKKGKAWAKVRRQVKQEFLQQGIVRCELCGIDNYLSFAHRLKRRFIRTETELKTVALLCTGCHNRIEVLPHAEMFAEVTELIDSREGDQRVIVLRSNSARCTFEMDFGRRKVASDAETNTYSGFNLRLSPGLGNG